MSGISRGYPESSAMANILEGKVLILFGGTQ